LYLTRKLAFTADRTEVRWSRPSRWRPAKPSRNSSACSFSCQPRHCKAPHSNWSVQLRGATLASEGGTSSRVKEREARVADPGSQSRL